MLHKFKYIHIYRQQLNICASLIFGNSAHDTEDICLIRQHFTIVNPLRKRKTEEDRGELYSNISLDLVSHKPRSALPASPQPFTQPFYFHLPFLSLAPKRRKFYHFAMHQPSERLLELMEWDFYSEFIICIPCKIFTFLF